MTDKKITIKNIGMAAMVGVMLEGGYYSIADEWNAGDDLDLTVACRGCDTPKRYGHKHGCFVALIERWGKQYDAENNPLQDTERTDSLYRRR